MAKKTTIAELHTLVLALTSRLDDASNWAELAQAKIVALEAQDTKTRKQLWYLQKIAKGEFSIGTNGRSTKLSDVAQRVEEADAAAASPDQPF